MGDAPAPTLRSSPRSCSRSRGRRGAGRKRYQRLRDAASAPVPVVGIAVHHRRLHFRQWLCLAVSRDDLAEPPQHARLTRHGAYERLHDIDRLVQAVPDLAGTRKLITAGRSPVSAGDYVTAAPMPDGTLLVAFIPPNHSGAINVDIASMSGPAREGPLVRSDERDSSDGTDRPGHQTLIGRRAASSV
jgi:hypothetical protein